MKGVVLTAAAVVLAASVAGQTSTGQGQTQRLPEMDRPVFLSGRVVLEDGTPPPEEVLVQRTCDGYAIPQGYTDARGNFSFELGLVHQMLNQIADPRKAYGEALLADPRFIKPYRQMAFLSFNGQKWEEVVEATDRWIGLDPVSYPEAYFFNAFANLYLNRPDAAERSAREAVKLDANRSIPRARYVLGAVLIEKKDYAGAAEQLRTYVEIAEPGPDVERAKQMLAQLEAKLGTRPVP